MSISEKDAEKIVKRLEKNVPDQGTWGSCHSSGTKQSCFAEIELGPTKNYSGSNEKVIIHRFYINSRTI
jgi:hypothetical protein